LAQLPAEGDFAAKRAFFGYFVSIFDLEAALGFE